MGNAFVGRTVHFRWSQRWNICLISLNFCGCPGWTPSRQFIDDQLEILHSNAEPCISGETIIEIIFKLHKDLTYFKPHFNVFNVFQCILSLLYLTTTQVYVLINYTAFIESMAVTSSVAALLWLRVKQPKLKRPIRVSLVLPIVFFVTCAFLVLLPFYVSPFETGVGAAITFSGIPVYMVTIYWKSKPRLYKRSISKTFLKLIQIN